MRKAFLLGLVLFLIAIGCAGSQKTVEIEKKEEKPVKPPVISRSFASPRIWPGETWRIYLTASDPDGEMKYIVSTIDQPGVGTYPVSLTRIKEEDRKELSGYIFLITFGLQNLNFVNLTLTVQIQDTAGNYSQPEVFPLSFNNTYPQEFPPPGVFLEKDLGPILIQLRDIGEEGPRLLGS